MFSEFSPSENLSLKIFIFSECHINDSDLLHLLTVLVENIDVVSKLSVDVHKITQELLVKLKRVGELRNQRLSKVPIYYQDRLQIVLEEQHLEGIIRKTRSDVNLGSLFTKSIIILPKVDTVNLLIEARYFISIPDLSNDPSPLEPLQLLLARVDRIYYTRSDLASAYQQVTP